MLFSHKPFNYIANKYFEKSKMKKEYSAHNRKFLKWGIYFVAIAAVSATIILATILEGNRIKKENELLSYEVW